MKLSVRKIAFSAVVAAVYAALTMSTPFMSYNAIQFRIAEALCILPFFFPGTVWGLFVGCIISNLISRFGIYDIIFGSLATLIAGLITAALGRYKESIWAKICACFMPVIANALIIGSMIALTSVPLEMFWSSFMPNAFFVGVGEFAVMYVIGLPLTVFLPRTAVFKLLSEKYNS